MSAEPKTKNPVGRPRRIETPEQLHEEFLAYMEDVKANPIKKPHMLNNGKQTTIDLIRPLTITGFCLWLDVDEATWRLWCNEREDLEEMISKIKAAIYNDKFEGAAVGIFNTNLITRDLGLYEHTSVDVRPVPPPPPPVANRHVANLAHPDCTDEQLQAIYEAGLEPPLYSQAQLEQGIEFKMPELPE